VTALRKEVRSKTPRAGFTFDGDGRGRKEVRVPSDELKGAEHSIKQIESETRTGGEKLTKAGPKGKEKLEKGLTKESPRIGLILGDGM